MSNFTLLGARYMLVCGALAMALTSADLRKASGTGSRFLNSVERDMTESRKV